jgi:broad specificity phosphatase PhoE
VVAVDTKVFLIRHGDTDWHEQGKLLGRRDRPLSEHGRAQSERILAALEGVDIREVIASPLQRALQTAEIIGKHYQMDIARDSRLTDMHLGTWEGKTRAELADTPEYQQFLSSPHGASVPGGENLEQVRRRAVAGIEQVLEDSATGDTVVVVTHSTIIRTLLVHYLSAPPATFHRLRISAGSASILSFSHDEVARILAVNWCPAIGDLAPVG